MSQIKVDENRRNRYTGRILTYLARSCQDDLSPVNEALSPLRTHQLKGLYEFFMTSSAESSAFRCKLVNCS